MKPCLGNYQVSGGECYGCPISLICIDVTIATDRHVDYLAERQREIEEMEADVHWSSREVEHEGPLLLL